MLPVDKGALPTLRNEGFDRMLVLTPARRTNERLPLVTINRNMRMTL
jgi:hypothetical protein